MNLRRPPPAAELLLLKLARASYREGLAGDLAEEFAAGRSAFWYWRQVGGAVREHANHLTRRHVLPLLAATTFFVLVLSFVAPVTFPVMGWAGSLESIGVLVVIAWLVGIPLLLGGVAGAAQRRRIGVVLLAAGIAYITPVSLPFNIALCDVCSRPAADGSSGAVRVLTPIGAALLAGMGAWLAGRLHRVERRRATR
jgi:hypothetical protein